MQNFEKSTNAKDALDIGHKRDAKVIEAVWIVSDESWKFKKKRLASGQDRHITDMDEEEVFKFLKKLEKRKWGRILKKGQIGYAIKIEGEDSLLDVGFGCDHIVRYKDKFFHIKR